MISLLNTPFPHDKQIYRKSVRTGNYALSLIESFDTIVKARRLL